MTTDVQLVARPVGRRHAAAAHRAPVRPARCLPDTKVLGVLVLLGLAIVVAVVALPDDMPFTSLMVPLLLGSLLLNPRHLPWFVIYMFALLMICLTEQANPTGAHLRRGRHPGADVPDRAGRLAAPLPARRRRRDGRVDVRRPARPDPPAGRHPGPAPRLARGVGAPLGRRYGVRGRLRRRHPRLADQARAGRGRRVRQGRGGRHPRAAALRRLRRPAGRAAGRPVPPGRQRLPAPPGLGRGVRHRHPPLPRPRRRQLRGPHRGPPAGRAAPGRHRPLERAAQRGADPGADAGRRVPGRRGPARSTTTRCCSTPTAWSRSRASTSTSASTGCWGRPSTCCAAASRAPPGGSWTPSARATTTARWSSFRGAEPSDR